MISLVVERIAELLHISIEQAEKIAPQLQQNKKSFKKDWTNYNE